MVGFIIGLFIGLGAGVGIAAFAVAVIEEDADQVKDEEQKPWRWVGWK